MLDICLLGTGGMMPLPDRWLASLLVRHNGKLTLFDCGEGTQIPLRLSGWGIKSIDTICFTHYHADHISGLPGLLLTIGNSARVEPLTLMGPPGLVDVVKGLTVISPELPYELRIVELSDQERTTFSVGDLVLTAMPADHRLPCLSYCMELKRQGIFDVNRAKALNVPMGEWGKLQKGETVTLDDRIIRPDQVLGPPRKGIKVSYCTDTRPREEFLDGIMGSDLLICEGIYGDDTWQEKAILKKHMLFSEAATLAKKGRVNELWLTHYSPALTNPEEFLCNARAVFENTHLGKDLMKQTFSFLD